MGVVLLVLAVLVTGCVGPLGGGGTPAFARSRSPRPMATARIAPATPPSGPESASLLGTPRARGGARPTPPPERGAVPAVFGQALVVDAIGGLGDRIRACYAELRRVRPDAAGRMVVTFSVVPGGAVEEVAVAENSTGSTELEGCVVRLVDALRIVPGPESVAVSYRYPFLFDPAQ
jgi:TonB family protein